MTVKVSEAGSGTPPSGTATFKVSVTNVGPVITSFTGTDYMTGPLAYIGGGPSQSTFHTKFTDPGADSPWIAAFTYSDGTPLSESVPRPNTDPFSRNHRSLAPVVARQRR